MTKCVQLAVQITGDRGVAGGVAYPESTLAICVWALSEKKRTSASSSFNSFSTTGSRSLLAVLGRGGEGRRGEEGRGEEEGREGEGRGTV